MSAKHTFKISEQVATILRQSQILEDKVILPDIQLDRKLYVEVSKILNAFDAKWNKKHKAHLLPPGGKAKLLQALDIGEAIREKVVLQAFYTPKEVAGVAAELLDLGYSKEPSVLEPSCGEGSLVQAVLELCPDAQFTVYELNKDALAITETLCSGNIEFSACSDFLTVEPPASDEAFDFIIMNPPYQKGQAQKHLLHALRFMANSGTLVAIMPTNWLTEEVNSILWGLHLLVEEFELPAKSFKASGTSINTLIVRIS